MAQSAKFLFDYSFDEHAEADAAKPDAAALAKQAQLQAELDAAFARGREVGLAEATADIAQRMIDATAAVTGQLVSIEKMRSEIEQSTTDAAIRLAIAVLRKLLPSFEQRSAMTEIEVVFSECLQRMLEEPRLVLRVPDDLLDAMRARVDENVRKAGFQGKVVLLADGGLGPSDCRIEWADGGAERNVERIWNDVEELVRRALHEPQKTPRESAPAAAPTT